MELSIKINTIKDCKLQDDLSIPYALHYNPDNSKRATREDFIKFVNHDDILDDKIFDIFIDDINDTVIIKKKLSKKHKKTADNKTTRKTTRKTS